MAGTNAEEIPPLRPPHGEISPGTWELYGGWFVIAVIFVLGMVSLATWFILRPRREIVLPPEIVARSALEAIRKQNEEQLILSRVSQILRRYIVRVFGLPTEELTTTEFCELINAHDQIGTELANAVGDFLRRCDKQKFAPSHSEPPVNSVENALHIVETIEARRAELRRAEKHEQVVT